MRRALIVGLVLWSGLARADDPDDSGLYLAAHPDAPWWLSAQGNSILQYQPGFHSDYQGVHSFTSSDHLEISFVATVFAGYAYEPTFTSAVVAGESAGGDGLSQALGIAGFTNLDVVRNPTLGPTPYVGRAYIDQIIPLSSEMVKSDRGPLHVFRTVPARRIEIHAGKLSTVDVFDTNEGATDSHLQFMNWSVDNNGAYDYAADTRGYTLGVTIEFIDKLWALRFGELLMPTIANGTDYDYDIANARGENLELEIHDCIARHPGFVRVLGFLNHANMGTYADAIAAYREDIDTVPDVTLYRVKGRMTYGVGLNAEQEVIPDLHVFGRFGWNNGKNESFAYTEIDNTLMIGGDLRGGRWSRPDDKVGIAGVSNGLSDGHKTYLELGGSGFILGDGKLHYGRENILEAYYTARAYRGVFPAVDIQLIQNPGYNVDRGPVVVGSVRLHLEL